jgi:hypothetical protein
MAVAMFKYIRPIVFILAVNICACAFTVVWNEKPGKVNHDMLKLSLMVDLAEFNIAPVVYKSYKILLQLSG